MAGTESTLKPRPFLKWVGGKAQLLEQFEELLPEFTEGESCYSRYHEPFLGGGAVFFHLQATGRLSAEPGATVLSDANGDLVSAYETVRDHAEALSRRLEELFAGHAEEEYYVLRDRFNEERLNPVERTAILIYLNKAGFNGLYRVNSKGKFNVPCGRQAGGPSMPSAAHLASCSKALQSVTLRHQSFESVLDSAEPGDFVYFDPPYVPLNDTSYFTSYAKDGFGLKDQERLRDVFAELDARGCAVMLSNSDTETIRELYRDFDIHAVSARRSINSKGKGRGAVDEVVVRNRVGA